MKTEEKKTWGAILSFSAFVGDARFKPTPEEWESIMGDVRRELLAQFPLVKCEYKPSTYYHADITIYTHVGEDFVGDLELRRVAVGEVMDQVAQKRHGVEGTADYQSIRVTQGHPTIWKQIQWGFTEMTNHELAREANKLKDHEDEDENKGRDPQG